MKTKIVYSGKYYVDIGAHVFPTVKYKLIKNRLLKDLRIVNKILFVEPQQATEGDILRVHTRTYLDKLKYGRLSLEEALTLELPYSKQLVESSILCCGGTIRAVEAAIEDRLGIHLGGGFHHAFPDHGEGFCVLNDIAVAIKNDIVNPLSHLRVLAAGQVKILVCSTALNGQPGGSQGVVQE